MPLDAGEMPNLPTGAAAEWRLEVRSADGPSLAVWTLGEGRPIMPAHGSLGRVPHIGLGGVT